MTFQAEILTLSLTKLAGMLVSGADIGFNVLIAVHLTFLVQPMIHQDFRVFDRMRIKCAAFNGQVV
ncbi:MAG: hypothetical protein ACFFDI_04170 [Promethearchaeota archaeon]